MARTRAGAPERLRLVLVPGADPVQQLVNMLVVDAVADAAAIALGYRMWWLRGRNGRPGRLQAAGQWRRTRPAVLAGIIVFLVAYSVMAPMFGISLVAFLIIDAVIQALRR